MAVTSKFWSKHPFCRAGVTANLFRRNLFASGSVPDFQKISEFVPWATVDVSLTQVQPESKYMFQFNNWSFSGGLRSGIATSYASARARSDMRISCIWCGCGSNSLYAWWWSMAMSGPSDSGPQKASTNHWYYSTQESEDGEVFIRFLSSSYSAIAISLDLRVS